MIELRRLLLGGLIVALLAISPVSPVAADVADPGIDADTYLGIWVDANVRGVDRPPDEIYDLYIDITGDAELDARIRALAEERGYRRQPVASVDLVPVDGRLLQAPAAEAWEALQAEARADGISLVLTSAFRDLRDQQFLFRDRLAGRTSDAGIDAALRISAPPGYSKHHTGYAIDVGQAGEARPGFVNTRAYAWLAADDFARAKAHGFVPSYPQDGALMGPDPEAWEFVWVGTGRIACALGADFPTGFCDVGPGPRADDITWLSEIGVTVGCAPGRFCPDDPVLRGEAASMLWRLHGAPAATEQAPFADVFATDHFSDAVDWLWSEGLTTGTSATTFSPDELLTPDAALAMLLRTGAADLPASSGLGPPVVDFAADPIVVGDIGVQLSRAEFASILRSTAIADARD
ncbi:MAG: D-alanyl-D-alanine carboxypeptidase family protein [Acidimicrobiales bacterium]|nr:D-alanyl-D-alanine carboxypeptidase family protein [Acidimicrobiales bacterium]